MMKFGISGVQAGRGAGAGAFEIARLAEDLGFESLWATEHVVMPADSDPEFPYGSAGKLHNNAAWDRPAPLVWLAGVAGVTSKIRLATGVVILPLRNPVLLAKEVATLDQLSSGRVLLGIGIGWMRSEFDALGSDFSDRGRRTDEYLQVLRRLWEPGPVSFTGKYISFGPIFCNPRPVHPEGIPLLIAGSSDFAARRAGRFGDGFTPLDVDVSRLQELLLVMRKEAEMAGRDPDAIELTVRGDADAQAIAAMERIGVDRYVLRAPDGVNLAENPDLLISLASQLGLEATKN